LGRKTQKGHTRCRGNKKLEKGFPLGTKESKADHIKTKSHTEKNEKKKQKGGEPGQLRDRKTRGNTVRGEKNKNHKTEHLGSKIIIME